LPVISDDRQHHITYRTGLDVRFASPEPELIGKTFDGERWRAYVAHELETEKREMTVESFGLLQETLLGVLKRERVPYIPEIPTLATEGLQVFRDIAYLSRTFFGAEFLLVHERQQSRNSAA
jgi:hypothetical protein